MKKASYLEKLNASLWCSHRLKQLLKNDKNYTFFNDAKSDILNNNIRYSINEPIGLHIDVLRTFAKAYLKIKQGDNEMKKRKIWQKRKYCTKCKGFRTLGGSKFKLFGLFTIKLTKYMHECRCYRYAGATELDKEKCKEVLKKQEDKNGNENK